MIGNSVPAADAARRCSPVWLESPAATKTAYPDIAPLTAGYGYRAHVDLPLVIGDRCVGVVAAALHQPRRFDEAEFTYRVAHRGDGAIDVEMRDFGRYGLNPQVIITAISTADAAWSSSARSPPTSWSTPARRAPMSSSVCRLQHQLPWPDRLDGLSRRTAG